MIIKSNRIYFEDGVRSGYLVVEQGKVAGYLADNATVTDYVDYTDKIVIPGLFDTHTHGCMGYNPASDEGDGKQILGYCKGQASFGTALVLPTAAHVDGGKAYGKMGDLCGQSIDGATIMGINSEGPFGNRVGEKGVDVPSKPIDSEYIARAIAESKGALKVMSFAPELPGVDEGIKTLKDAGVKVGMMHTNCNYAQAWEAFDKGIDVVVHVCNVMTGIHHRNMGTLGAALLRENLMCELICDGLHVCNEMLQIVIKMKGVDNLMMITDLSSLAGAAPGQYEMKFMGGKVAFSITPEGFCLTDTGRLMGSTKPLIWGFRNLVKNCGVAFEDALKMATLNPAKFYGFDATKGSIAFGKDADLTVIDDDFNVYATYCDGRQVYAGEDIHQYFDQDYLDTIRVK